MQYHLRTAIISMWVKHDDLGHLGSVLDATIEAHQVNLDIDRFKTTVVARGPETLDHEDLVEAHVDYDETD